MRRAVALVAAVAFFLLISIAQAATPRWPSVVTFKSKPQATVTETHSGIKYLCGFWKMSPAGVVMICLPVGKVVKSTTPLA